MKKIIICISLLIFITTVSFSQSNSENGISGKLQAAGTPYFLLASEALHGYNLSVLLSGKYTLDPFIFGLQGDVTFSYIYGGVPTTAPLSVQYGSWSVIHADAFFGFLFSEYFSVLLGAGWAWDVGSIFEECIAIPLTEYPYNRNGINTFLNVNINFGFDFYDINLLSYFDFFSELHYYAGIKNNFYFFDRFFHVFLELGIKNFYTDLYAGGAVIPHEINTNYITATVGVIIHIPQLRQNTEQKVTVAASTEKIDFKEGEKQINELKNAKAGDVITFTNIIFFPDQAVIKIESFPILEQIAQYLTTNQDVIIELRGYTNYLGTPDQEQELSKARAEAVKKYMINKGIKSFRMITIGYGSIYAKNKNVEEENRRVEIKIISKE